MSAQHTPGPWQAHHDHGWLVVESDNGDLYVKIEKGSAACKHMANARLIAAAPEMLEALTKLVEDLEMRSNWKHGNEKGVVDCGNSVYLKARAAIAKAERGEQ